MNINQLLSSISKDRHSYNIIYNGYSLKNWKFRNGDCYQINTKIIYNLKDFLVSANIVEEISEIFNLTEDVSIPIRYEFNLDIYSRVIIITDQKYLIASVDESLGFFIRFSIRLEYLKYFYAELVSNRDTYFNGNVAIQLMRVNLLREQLFILPTSVGNNLPLFDINSVELSEDFVLFKEDYEYHLSPRGYFPNIKNIGDYKGILMFKTKSLNFNTLTENEKLFSVFYKELPLLFAGEYLKFESSSIEFNSKNISKEFLRYYFNLILSDDFTIKNFLDNYITLYDNDSVLNKILIKTKGATEYECLRRYPANSVVE